MFLEVSEGLLNSISEKTLVIFAFFYYSILRKKNIFAFFAEIALMLDILFSGVFAPHPQFGILFGVLHCSFFFMLLKLSAKIMFYILLVTP